MTSSSGWLQAMQRHLWHPDVTAEECKARNVGLVNAPRSKRQLSAMKQALVTAIAKVDQQLVSSPRDATDANLKPRPPPLRRKKNLKHENDRYLQERSFADNEVYVHEGYQDSATHRKVLTDSGIQWVRIAPATHRPKHVQHRVPHHAQQQVQYQEPAKTTRTRSVN